ncbi:HSP20-like chaperone [Helicostylum pulchrum]|nr:HSP20-like chaperone [Helicostylum pulchrum]
MSPNLNERVENRVDEVIGEFFTECPYGRKAVSGCPALSEGNKPFSSDYASQFFNECPYGKRAQKQCPYGRRLSRDSSKHPDFVDQYFKKCPSGHKAVEECPYGKRLIGKTKEHDDEFFSECPYGKRATEECPYGREVLSKLGGHGESFNHKNCKQFDEFFTECPYGRKAAEDCPYGHKVLEKAGIPVADLKKHTEGDPAKCPFASMAGDDKSKCPVGGVMPQSENCPISPNYKKVLTPTIDFYENDNEFRIFVELPGIDKSNVKLEIKDKILKLTAEINPTSDMSSERPHFTERKFGTYSRSITLSNNVSLEEIVAKMENGVLTIVVPKSEPTAVRTININ